MQNYKAFDKIREEFAKGEHFQSAEKENEQYVNSLDGKLNKLKEIWIDTFTTIVDSDFTYGLLDGLIAVSEGVNKVVSSLMKLLNMVTSIKGGLGGSLFAGMSMFKNIGSALDLGNKNPISNLEAIKKSIEDLVNVYQDGANKKKEAGEELSEPVKAGEVEYSGSNVDTDTDSDIDKKKKEIETEASKKPLKPDVEIEISKDTGEKAGKELTEDMVKGIKDGSNILNNIVAESMEGSVQNVDDKVKKTSSSLKSLGSTIASIGKSALVSFGVGMAVELGARAVFGIYDSLVNKYQNQRQAIQERTEALKQDKVAHEQNLSWMQNNAKRYDELIKKEKEYNKIDKNSWTSQQKAEMEELVGMKKHLAELNPELVAGYDEMGNPIIAMTDSMQGLIDKTKEEINLLNTQIKQQAIDNGNNSRDLLHKKSLTGSQQDKTQNSYDSMLASAEKLHNLSVLNTSDIDAYFSKRNRMQKDLTKNQQAFNKEYQETAKLEAEIQAGQLAKFQNQANYQSLNANAQSGINKIIGSLDWGELNDTELTSWQNGIDSIINKFPQLGNKATGIIGKLEQVNSAFAGNKIGTVEYITQIDKLANQFSELTGMDFETVKKGFTQMFTGFDANAQGRINLLKAFNKELKDVQTDSVAESLVKQYDDTLKLDDLVVEGKVDTLLEFTKNGNALSQEINDYLEGALADGNFDNKEKTVTLFLNEVVRHGGTANAKDQKYLQDILDGKLDKKDIELGIKMADGTEYSAKELVNLLGANEGLSPEQKIKVADILDTDGLEQKKNLINNAFKEIKFGSTRGSAFEAMKESSLSTKEEIDSLAQAVEKIPQAKRTDFVSNYAESFKGVKNMEEGIKNLPDTAKLVYNVGIEGDEGLEKLKSELDSLKGQSGQQIKTYLEFEQIGIEDFRAFANLKPIHKQVLIDYLNNNPMSAELFQQLVTEYPDQIDKYINILTNSGLTEDEISKIKTVEELIEKLPPEVKSKVKLEVDDSERKKLEEPTTEGTVSVKKSTDKQGNVKANVDAGDAVKAIDNLNKKIQSLKSKKITVTVATQTARKNISGLLVRVEQINTALSSIKGKTITVNTAQARQNISGLIRKADEFSSKVNNKTITFTAHTAQARKNISGLIKRANQYKGKTYHASCIAHTSKAYSKISALIAKCRAYGGKTYHASFIAHTAHAYSKISALVSKAQSYSGRTFHASMTVTTNKVEKIISKPSGNNEAPANLTRTVTTTYANDGIMPIDEPTPVSKPSIFSRSRAKDGSANGKISIPFKDYGEYLKKMTGQAGALKEAFMLMHQMVDKAIKDTVGKTTKLADIVKQGTTVVLTSISSGVKDIMDALKFDINRLQELDNTIARISHSIDVLDKKLDNSVGSQRIAFLQRQNLELKKRIKLNEELLKQKKREKEIYKQELKKKGLKFTKDDNISNYEEMMLKLKREMEKLDQTSEKLSQKNEKRDEKEQKRIEKRKKEIEELIKLMEAYNKVVFGDIFDIESSIIEDSNQVENNELEIKQIEYEKWVVRLESAFKNVNKELQKLTNQLEMLDVQMKHAWGKEKLDLMNKQIDLIKKSQSALKDNLTVMESAKNSAKEKLIEYGFKFNSNGDIENFVEQMNHLKDTSKEFDTIQGLVDGYFDLYLEQIPEAQRELAEFTNQIKDIYKQQLEATKELEDKIIDMYKKQLEERKKLIDEELKKRLDALKKEQDAYKKAREEQNYKNDFNEQADKVKDIQKQIDLARKDTSLTGQKKLKDLLKQLEEEKKKLDEITQDRIDQQVDNAFKDEEDRLQQGAEDEKDRLDKEFSDEELLKKAQEAIKNGLFIGIDGEVKNLQSALLEYIDKWEEGLSATGAIIKSEWITNLEIANDLIKDYAGKLEDLGVGSLNTNEIYGKNANVKSESAVKSEGTSINYNQPLVVVQGNVDNNNIEQIKRVVQESIDRNNREILRKI